MAADGSIIIKSKINNDGADAGINELKSALKELTTAIHGLTGKMAGSFSTVGVSASKAAKDIGGISDATKTAQQDVKSMEEQMAAITITGLDTPEIFVDGDFDVYGNQVDMAIAKTQELSAATDTAMHEVRVDIEEAAQAPTMLENSVNMAINSFRHIPLMARAAIGALKSAFDSAGGSAATLQDEIDRYTDALYYAEQAGHGLGDAPYDKAYKGLQLAKQKAEAYQKELMGVDSEQKKVQGSAKKMNKSLRNTDNMASALSKSIFKLGNMFRLMLVRMAMRAVIDGVKEGFKNLARYSDDTNKALSMLMSALTRLKNGFATAFSPLVEFIAPALSHMINLLSEATAWISHLFAALSGKDTFVKAVKVQQDFAESLKETKDAAKEAAKAAKKLIAPFDDLVQLTNQTSDIGKGELDPKDMFELVEVENSVKLQAQAIKDAIKGLFDPLKKSWEENGPAVMESLKYTFSEIKALAGSIASSFMQVWNAEGYGKAITDNLIKTITNLITTVGNLANRFRVAWDDAETGTKIIRNLGDIIVIITGFFKSASAEIEKWSRTVDFGPLLKSFQGVLSSITPIVDKVSSILLFLLKNVLLPIAKWAIEQALPAAFDFISAALKVFNSVLDVLQPMALWLWEEFLQPIGEWAGRTLIAAIKEVTSWLTKFSDWILENRETVEYMAIVIGSFFLAWKFVDFITGVTTMISLLPNLVGKLASLLGGINPLVLAITAIISLVGILAKNWDAMTPTEKMIAGVLAAASAVGILAVAIGALGGPAGAALFAAALAAGIASATIAINAGKRKLNTSASSGSSGSGYSSYSTPASAYSGLTYNMPHLATGTVVPPRAGEFAAILGDNNRDYEVVSPLETIKQALKEAISEVGGLGGGNQIASAEMILDGQRFGRIVVKLGDQEKQRIGVRMVAEGGV